ncbi:hypothetical protein J6590_105668, partial [Homalodisca vitripennis]
MFSDSTPVHPPVRIRIILSARESTEPSVLSFSGRTMPTPAARRGSSETFGVLAA